jgi:hypothetical protein
MSYVSADHPVNEPWVFLIGRPPIDEYLSFLIQASPGDNVNVHDAAERWRAAATVIDELGGSEAGIADQPPTSAVPPALAEQAAR